MNIPSVTLNSTIHSHPVEKLFHIILGITKSPRGLLSVTAKGARRAGADQRHRTRHRRNLDALAPAVENLALLLLGTGQMMRQFCAAVEGPNAQIPKDPAEDDEADKVGHHCALLLCCTLNNNVHTSYRLRWFVVQRSVNIMGRVALRSVTHSIGNACDRRRSATYGRGILAATVRSNKPGFSSALPLPTSAPSIMKAP